VTSTYDIDLAGALFNGPIILGGPGGGGTTCADGDAGLICRIQRWLAIMTKPKTIVKPPPPPPQPPPTCGRFGCVGDLVCDQINDLTNIACGKGTPYQTTKSRTSECLEAKRRFDMGCFPGCCFP
jgi:hypothetical protein